MANYRYEREVRTPSSEAYRIEGEGGSIGRVDLHFTESGLAQATLCVAESLTEEEVQELIDDIDERLVLTADPYREDLVVTVWAGRPAGVFHSEVGEEEFEEEEEAENDGHRP